MPTAATDICIKFCYCYICCIVPNENFPLEKLHAAPGESQRSNLYRIFFPEHILSQTPCFFIVKFISFQTGQQKLEVFGVRFCNSKGLPKPVVALVPLDGSPQTRQVVSPPAETVDYQQAYFATIRNGGRRLFRHHLKQWITEKAVSLPSETADY